MKKPKKTLKELSRLEAYHSKLAARAVKVLARRKQKDGESDVLSGFYDRLAAMQATAQAELSAIDRLIESLKRQVADAEAAKAARKDGKKAVAKGGPRPVSVAGGKSGEARPAGRRAAPKPAAQA